MEGFSNIAFICYSHSSYSDVWDMFWGQLNKYIPTVKKYFFVDKLVKPVSDDIKVILYEDLLYSDKFLKCLESIKEPFCIYHQEDMVLYNKPNLNKIKELTNFIKEYNVDYIKLLKGGHQIDVRLEDMPIDNLFYIPHDPKFLSYANQPTIWKTKTLKQIFKNTSNTDIRDFETKASLYMNTTDILGLYWHDNEKKRGMSHWDSSIYPFGGMIFKGKWVYSEYNTELTQLHKKYNINKNLRGVV